MEFLDARRLTGPSLLLDRPGSILDVRCTREDAEQLIPVWADHVARMLEELDWPSAQFSTLHLAGGVSLAFTAPIDALYAASEINEWAWAASARELGVAMEAPDFDAAVAAIKASARDESNGELMWLLHEARERGKTALWDDDHVSVGLGRGSETWPVREIADAPDWNNYHDVPTGHKVGCSSTDWIAINDDVLDRGDWSGPGGARTVLRHQEVDVAILETARGGLLRRGLGVERADAALITNISEDHLGDFGSQDLDELLNIKWIVSRAVEKSGRLILNADDVLLCEKARDFAGELVWFSLDPDNPTIVAHADSGGSAFVLDGDELVRLGDGGRIVICRSHEIPIAMGGAARHNVANALAAAALTDALGVTLKELRDGLKTMVQDENPGRSNLYDLDDRAVLVDFAHNPAAMMALFDMARAVPAKRRVLCFGQAGDRTDALIRELARDAWAIGLDRIIVSELAAYHRGREHGDVFAIIKDELMRCGADDSQIEHNETEMESFMSAIEWAQPGDLVIMLALGGAAAVQERLKELGAQ
jgi:hypothetical protein